MVRFSNGTNTFSLVVKPQVTTIDAWYTIGVPLDAAFPGWFGSSITQFSNTLGSVTFVDVQVTKSGTGAQTYYLDNFRLVNEIIFVPEPTSGLFWFGWAWVFGGLRRRINAVRRQRSPYALSAAPRSAG